MPGASGQPEIQKIGKREQNLIRAVKSGDLQWVKDAIKPFWGLVKGPAINFRDSNGTTPLIESLKHKDESIAIHLIENGADVNLASEYGRTPLIEAISKYHEKTVEILLSKGANPNECDWHGTTPLMMASSLQLTSLDIIKLLISKGADINATDKNDYSVLEIANRYGCKDIADLLIESGAEVSQRKGKGHTDLKEKGEINEALAEAVCRGDINSVRYFLMQGANPNQEYTYGIVKKEYKPILLIAVSNRQYEIAELLVERGAEVHYANEGPILKALNNVNSTYFIKWLLSKGANVNECDSKGKISGRTPIFEAVRMKNIELVNLFLSAGADITREITESNEERDGCYEPDQGKYIYGTATVGKVYDLLKYARKNECDKGIIEIIAKRYLAKNVEIKKHTDDDEDYPFGWK